MKSKTIWMNVASVIVIGVMLVFAAGSDDSSSTSTEAPQSNEQPDASNPQAVTPQSAPVSSANRQIDYDGLLTDAQDPAGTATNLKRAARLAIKGPNCSEVIGGFYIPPDQQLPAHAGKQYMINCKSTAGAAFNVYFSKADLEAGNTKSTNLTPVSRDIAVHQCVEAVFKKYPHASGNLLGGATYYVSKASARVRVNVDLKVENASGNKVNRTGSCLIDPDGKMIQIWLSNG